MLSRKLCLLVIRLDMNSVSDKQDWLIVSSRSQETVESKETSLWQQEWEMHHDKEEE